MIRLLNHKDIDKEKWDACVLQSSIPLPYAESWYLDAVAPGWSALVRGDYQNVMPLCPGRRFTIDYLYQPALAQQLGVFGEKADEHSEIFIKAIAAKFRFIDVQLNADTRIPGKIEEIRERKNMLLDLNRPIGEIRAAYSANHRRNIRKAERTAPAIVNASGQPSTVIRLFRENRGEKLKLPHDFYPALDRVLASGQPMGRIQVSVALLNEQPAAGIIWLTGSDRCVLLFSGANESAKKHGFMHKLVDHKIAALAGQEIKLDFEGSDHSGLGRFYLGFGAYVSLYLHWRSNRLPAVFRWLK